jgi:RNA 3'-terminal phosphate cyclase
MLVPYVALAEGESIYLTRELSDHLDTNIWLAQAVLGKRFSVEKANGLFMIRKM